MRYLNFNDLRMKLGGRSRTSCYRDMALGFLPKPLKLGGRLYWIEEEVDALLIEHRNAQSGETSK